MAFLLLIGVWLLGSGSWTFPFGERQLATTPIEIDGPVIRETPVDLFLDKPHQTVEFLDDESLVSLASLSYPYFTNPTTGLLIHETGVWAEHSRECTFPKGATG